MELSNIKIVLVGTTHPGNIGAAARAMKVMGLKELVLVNPKKFPNDDASAMSSGADDLLQNAEVFDSLNSAIADCTVVFGLTARERRLAVAPILPEDCSAKIVALDNTTKAALVFGRESSGLSNEELDLCNYLVHIPTNADYSSLNLAAAVQVMSYEIRKAYLATYLANNNDAINNNNDCENEMVLSSEMELFYQHLEEVMSETGFYNPNNPRKLMRRIRRLFNRAKPDQNEMNILRGILAAVQRKYS